MTNEVHETDSARYAIVGVPGDYHILDRKVVKLSKKQFKTLKAATTRVAAWIEQDKVTA